MSLEASLPIRNPSVWKRVQANWDHHTTSGLMYSVAFAVAGIAVIVIAIGVASTPFGLAGGLLIGLGLLAGYCCLSDLLLTPRIKPSSSLYEIELKDIK